MIKDPGYGTVIDWLTCGSERIYRFNGTTNLWVTETDATTTSYGVQSYAVGHGTAFGNCAIAEADSAALGRGAAALSGKTVAVGSMSYAVSGSTSVGYNASCYEGSTAVGKSTYAMNRSTAFGENATCPFDHSTAANYGAYCDRDCIVTGKQIGRAHV